MSQKLILRSYNGDILELSLLVHEENNVTKGSYIVYEGYNFPIICCSFVPLSCFFAACYIIKLLLSGLHNEMHQVIDIKS